MKCLYSVFHLIWRECLSVIDNRSLDGSSSRSQQLLQYSLDVQLILYAYWIASSVIAQMPTNHYFEYGRSLTWVITLCGCSLWLMIGRHLSSHLLVWGMYP